MINSIRHALSSFTLCFSNCMLQCVRLSSNCLPVLCFSSAISCIALLFIKECCKINTPKISLICVSSTTHSRGHLRVFGFSIAWQYSSYRIRKANEQVKVLLNVIVLELIKQVHLTDVKFVNLTNRCKCFKANVLQQMPYFPGASQ